MKTNELDERVLAALNEQDRRLFERLDAERGIFEEVRDSFASRNRWLVVLGVVYSLAAVGFAVFCAVRFFDAEGTRAMIAWATGFVVSMLIVSIAKVWYWLEMNRNAVAREVKRVELQVAALSRSLERGGGGGG